MMAQERRKTSEVFKEERAREVAELSNKVFGRRPKRVAFPGGTSRSAFIVDMGDAPYVFAKREDRADAQLEAIVLKCLGKTGNAPKLKALVDEWVVQECLQGERLPVVMDRMTSMVERSAVVSSALESLLHLQEAAMSEGLQHRVPKVGTVEKWVWNRTGAAKRMSSAIKIKAPDIDREWLTGRMEVKRNEFIKWDARPGNAMVDGDSVYWFDWEDCGRSRALDDLAFVLCDEWMSLDAASEAALERQFLPLYNRSLSADEAHEYLRLFGMTHTIIRLRMALKFRLRDGKWWDRQMCLNGDKVGVTAEETARLVARGKRLADDVAGLRPYIVWLDEVAAHFEIPSCSDSELNSRAA